MPHKRLSQAKQDALIADLRWRDHVRRYLLPRTAEAIGERLGLSQQTIHNAEKRQSRTMAPEIYREIINLRAEYWLARREMEGYTLDALSDRHGLCRPTVCRCLARINNERCRTQCASNLHDL